ncbi:AbaSI family restriction endonuclease [Arsenicibacter rosenii]|uniref:Uncharacterized protein n=1 Tax=Arsenicibacter rosenii TaxID=1750698 RepID=A0A1S2VPL7_9BACT|nr:hypothetical protein [Arsenicibacter rosenii]OIN60713.1 hypothetical protein BLX24_00975 [Arsenicibacter rosenii]
MNKLDYITRQLAKAQKKRFEHYVVTRIWHLLNDLSIKFVTQQYVSRPDGRALTDIFFPQLQIHIEVDEGYHKKLIDEDRLREADIINATGHEIIRIDVTQKIEAINAEIDQVIQRIKQKKVDSTSFSPWDIEFDYSPEKFIGKGFIDISDDCSFFRKHEAASCFGKSFKNYSLQYGEVQHPTELNKSLWFPKLYANEKWNNLISNDEKIITEYSKSEDIQLTIEKVLKKGYLNRIVFARVKSSLGDTMYRFKGEYELDLLNTNSVNGLIWRKVSDRVNTYKSTEAH